jgi:hypothetical protein
MERKEKRGEGKETAQIGNWVTQVRVCSCNWNHARV